MPPRNGFRHQVYNADPPEGPVHFLKADPGPSLDQKESRDRMRAAGESFRAARIASVYLIHGTFVGSDALGLFGEISHFAPSLGKRLRRWQKRTVDSLTRDAANYTEEYAREFERLAQIPVRLFIWSGENHHIGRAHGALQLLEALAGSNIPEDHRVLVWAHSHGGNVLALVTNLLGGDREIRDRFFQAARSYYRGSKTDQPVWPRVRQMLDLDDGPLARLRLDIVSFGTPIRYGWDSGGYGKLLHFVNHEPAPGLPEHRAPFPPDPMEVLEGAGGDHIQQLGIAGTNFPPSLFSWRTWLANRRLNVLLEPGIRQRDLLSRLRIGKRVPDEGRTMLVDYGERGGNILEHVAGHAVYTRGRWLLFHAEQVSRWI